MKRIYFGINPTTKEQVLESLASDDLQRICTSIIEASMTIDDWRWVQELCLRNLTHEHQYIRKVSATALGHLARIHGRLDLSRALPALQNMCRNDPEIYGRGTAEDTLEGIAQVWKPVQDPA